MINIKRALGLIGLLFLFASANAHAATYYFSTSGSNTTGNGSLTAPFYNLCNSGCTTGANKISLNQIPVNPGDQLLFKRGDEWVGADATWTINATGATNNPITFGAYGDSNLPRPVFRGAKSAYELGKDNWTNVVGTSIWYTTGVNWSPNMGAQEDSAVDGAHLFAASSVQGVTNTNGWVLDQSMVRGTYFYESSTQRFYVWRTDGLKPDHTAGRNIYIGVEPTDGTFRLVKVWRGWAGTNTDPKYVGAHYVFQDLHVKMSSALGFSTSYPDTQYINCLSELNGFEGFLFDRRRFGAPLPAAKDGVMRNCVSRRNNLAQGGGIGQGITVESENVWIYDSESYENGYAGVDFLDYDVNTKTDGGGIVNSKIHHNGIQPVNMISFDPNVYIDGGSNITIRDSEIWAAGVDPRGTKTRLRPNPGISIDVEGGGFNAGKRPTNIKVVNTFSYGNTGEAIRIGYINGNQSTPAFSNIQVIGSTLHRDRNDNDIPGYASSSYADTGVRVLSFRNMSSGLVYKNNILTAMNTVRAPIFGSITMLDAGKSVMDFDNNIYYCPGCDFNTTGSGFFTYGSASMTIDQFRNLGAQASLQQDAALSKTVMTSNPLLTNLTLAGFDARLLNGSPAIDIANVSVFPMTLTGTTRADGLLDNPYNDLGFHYQTSSTQTPPPPPPADTQAPSAPTALASTLSGTQISLAWTASTDNVGVTGYQIFDGATQVGNSATNSFIMTGVLGQRYSFTVKAFDAANNFSSPSNTVTLTVVNGPDTTAPTVPMGVSVSFVGTQASITWNASTDNVGVAGYQVFMVVSSWTFLGQTTGTSYTKNSLIPGQTYRFVVRAFDVALNYSAYASSASVIAPTTTLPAPTNLLAFALSGQAQLSWSASTGAVGYNVYRDNVLLKSVGGTSTFDNAVTAGSTYRYKVEAYDTSNAKSLFSNEVSITIPAVADTTAPSAPTGLSASLFGTTANLSWTASIDNVAVTGYQVFQGTTLKGTTAATTYAVTGLTQGQTYSFSVKAFDAANNLSTSINTASVTVPAADTTAPSAPTSLTAALIGTTANLSWAASTDNVAVTGYQVFQDTTLKGTPTSTTYSITGLTQGQTYSFSVKATDAANNISGASNSVSVSVSVSAAGPATPANLIAYMSGSSVYVGWTSSSNAAGYALYRSGTLLKSVTSVSTTDSIVTAGQSYTYQVKAFDVANNYSGFSNSMTVAVPVPPDTTAPSIPANLSASLNGAEVVLTWTPSSDNVAVTDYEVFQGGIAKGTTTATAYTVPGLLSGQSYVFTVRARDAANNYSGFSNTASIVIPVSILGVPSQLRATQRLGTVTLVWDAALNALGYRVFRDDIYLQSVQETSTTNRPNKGLHRYKVQAYDSFGNFSDFSNEVTLNIG